MRKAVIRAAAAATVAVTGLAFAQERQSGQEQKPAAGQMERGQSNQPAIGATGKEGAAAPAQGKMGEERQGQGVKTGATAQERGNEGSVAGQRQGGSQTGLREGQAGVQNNQRQGEARSNETLTQKEQAGQAGKQQHGASQAQTERGANTREPGKAAEGQNRTQGAQSEEGQQRAGEANRTENGQGAQTERSGMQGNAAERGGVTKQNREGAGQTAPSPNREGMAHEGQTSTAGTNGAAATVEARGNAHLSSEQASRISDTLRTTAAPAQTSVNIDVNVDEPLPGNVDLMPLPPAVVSIVPEYRGYDYVVVHDEIVIVQPSTRKVVEVIHRSGETHAMGEGVGQGHRLTLNQSQQRLIKETVTREHPREAQVQEQLSYGVTVPQDMTLEPVPQPLIAQIPMIEQYRMFITDGDRILLVDPDTREVVEVIE
jgi:hypothetical protein